MKQEEYESLIDDPTDFWLRSYLPRIFGTMEPFASLAPLNGIVEIPNVSLLANFGLPGMRETLNKLADAGEELIKVREALGKYRYKIMTEMGYPMSTGAGAKAPFDILADTLRASRGMIRDMYRKRDAIERAMERLTPLQIKGAAKAVQASGNPIVFMPLHKGADRFMSDEQFEQLYWPSLKAVILGLVGEGCVPYLFAEGGYNTRLEYLKELPKGTTMWLFDQTDMAKAKKQVGDTICIAGNVPTSMMVTGSPAEVDEYCKKLIEICAPGGGYILTTGAGLDEGKADTTRALLEAVEKYGKY
jgi:uroporphyrinogen-III decarboxylase